MGKNIDEIESYAELDTIAQLSFLRAKIRLLDRYNYLIQMPNKSITDINEFNRIADLVLAWYVSNARYNPKHNSNYPLPTNLKDLT